MPTDQVMKPLLANPLELASLSEKDKGALVRLLSDPDPRCFKLSGRHWSTAASKPGPG